MKKNLALGSASRNVLSGKVRRGLYARCLNLEFDTLLQELKSLPLGQLDES